MTDGWTERETIQTERREREGRSTAFDKNNKEEEGEGHKTTTQEEKEEGKT